MQREMAGWGGKHKSKHEKLARNACESESNTRNSASLLRTLVCFVKALRNKRCCGLLLQVSATRCTLVHPSEGERELAGIRLTEAAAG
jgi:hypothetical protein